MRHVTSFLLISLSTLLITSCGDEAGDATLEAQSAVKAATPIDPARELLITDPSVVGSVVETNFDPQHPSGTNKSGAWSFGRLVHNMLPKAERHSAQAASHFVMNWLKTWEVPQSPNPAVSPAFPRSSIRLLLINPWKEASGCASPASPATDASCTLDMRVAPFKLMAIVNRPDLRIVATDGTAIAGEGRFVFQAFGPTLGKEAATGNLAIMDDTFKAQKFTIIFEYALPIENNAQTLAWAQAWHELGSQPFGPQYRHKLLKLTNAFAGPDADRRRPNGNALNQLRTNEVALQGARFPSAGFVADKQFWELREFHLTASGLAPHTANLEPARDFDIPRAAFAGLEGTRSDELMSYLNANASAVLANKHRLPHGMSANSALVGSAPYAAWGKLKNPNPPATPSHGMAHNLGDVAVNVRDIFALNTCAGCHRHETDTRHFMHISFLEAMEPADKVDDRFRIGVDDGTPEDTVVVSNVLKADVMQGGGRFEDFAQLLATPMHKLSNRPGLRMCAD